GRSPSWRSTCGRRPSSAPSGTRSATTSRPSATSSLAGPIRTDRRRRASASARWTPGCAAPTPRRPALPPTTSPPPPPKTAATPSPPPSARHKDGKSAQERKRVAVGSRAGGLGPTFEPFLPTGGTATANMQLRLPAERLDDRRALLKQLDGLKRGLDDRDAG